MRISVDGKTEERGVSGRGRVEGRQTGRLTEDGTGEGRRWTSHVLLAVFPAGEGNVSQPAHLHPSNQSSAANRAMARPVTLVDGSACSFT